MLARELVNERAHERDSGPGTYGPELAATALAEAMATRVAACGPDADLAEVAEIMLAHDVREVLVLDDGDVLGMVTDRDLLRSMLRLDTPRQAAPAIVLEVESRRSAGQPSRASWPTAAVSEYRSPGRSSSPVGAAAE